MENPQFLIINTHRQHQPYRNPTGDWLGIHYIAAFLNENGIRAMAFAGYAHEVPELLDEFLPLQSLAAIGFSCDYENRGEVAEFCRRVRSVSRIPIVIGGPQAAFLEPEFVRETGAAALVCGEGEVTTLELMMRILIGDNDFSAVRGIRFLKDGKLVATPPRPLIRNLDALPFPNAKFALGSLFRPTLASFLTGRGCPYSCSFCYEGGNTGGVRWRSVENVIREISAVLEERPDIHYLMFTDDTFTVDQERVKAFCVQLQRLREKYSFTWFCEGHVSTIYGNKDLLRMMIDAGLSCLQIGIESGDDEVLRAYNKHITAAMIESVVKDAYDSGLEQLWGNIILGGALETPERIRKNIEFCRRLYALAPGMINMDVVHFWPLPGTRITTAPEKFGMKILDPDSLSSAMDFPVVEYPDLSVQQLCEARTSFMRALEKAAFDLIPAIPPERVRNLMTKHNHTSNFSVWLRVIIQTEEYSKFFSLLNCGAAVLSSRISEKHWRATHPMRTGHPERFTPDGRLIVHDRELSAGETKILCLASGKMNWEELLGKSGLPEEDYKTLLRKLESECLLTFSKY